FRVIHAEPIPGDRQFWVTRPYRWQSLLAAKMMFIVAFVHIPLAFSQMVIVGRAGFPVAANWDGLAWEQVFQAANVTLPAAVLAAVTSGMIGFALSALGVFAVTMAVG